MRGGGPGIKTELETIQLRVSMPFLSDGLSHHGLVYHWPSDSIWDSLQQLINDFASWVGPEQLLLRLQTAQAPTCSLAQNVSRFLLWQWN